MISAYTADNASVNYGKYNSVFQKLKADNSGIIKANCMAHIVHNGAKDAGDRLDIDIQSLFSVLKTYRRIENSIRICGRRLSGCTATHTHKMVMFMARCQEAT